MKFLADENVEKPGIKKPGLFFQYVTEDNTLSKFYLDIYRNIFYIEYISSKQKLYRF